jgi:SagB-type dehydrogenase family enzyme
LFKRRTKRNFSYSKQIGIKELSIILSGVGITHMSKKGFKFGSLRAYPSAGARYPLEIYVVILRSNDLKKGIYHYHVRTNSIEYMWDIDKKSLVKCFSSQSFIKNSSAIIIISGVMNRVTMKYSDRGYRFALIEAGHAAQNLSLIAEALKLKCCSIGGFLDDELADILELSGDELALYGIALN